MRLALTAWSIAVICFLGPVAVPAQAPATGTAAQKKSPYAKLVEPWPDAEAMRQRRTDAENRRLFQSGEPLALTITADFKTVNKDRNESSTKRYPATLAVAGAKGDAIPVRLGTRGHFRLRQTSCSFVPLRVEFPGQETAGTPFERQKALKLITHCREDKVYEQYILHEYLVYRILNLLTPRSFRARLARVTYVDTSSDKAPVTRTAMFLEDDDDVARRMGARIVDLPNLLFKDVDAEALTLMAIFQYMIGNTDYSLLRLHNVRVMQSPTRILYTVPYDFDFAGLANTQYAIADKRLGIASVRERLYRGPCRSEGELAPVVEAFMAKKADIMALNDSLPDLDPSYRRNAREYLEDFFSTLSRQDRVKKALIDGCSRSGM